MKSCSYALQALALCAAMLTFIGCSRMPGYPKPGPEVARPDDVLDFDTLYKQNCAGCHGENGRGGAALALNNPAYLAIAGEANLRAATANGVHGTLMPAFARSAGGMLTETQIQALVEGMYRDWGHPAQFAGIALPPYADTTPGNAAEGQKTFVAACARCHGADGTGVKPVNHQPLPRGASPDTIIDPSYLALVSDQSLRSLILGGRPDQDVPDWRSYITSPAPHALTSQETNNIVAWLAQHRDTPPDQAMQTGAHNAPQAAGPKTSASPQTLASPQTTASKEKK